MHLCGSDSGVLLATQAILLKPVQALCSSCELSQIATSETVYISCSVQLRCKFVKFRGRSRNILALLLATTAIADRQDTNSFVLLASAYSQSYEKLVTPKAIQGCLQLQRFIL